MNSIVNLPEFQRILSYHDSRMSILQSAELQIGVIEHDFGHLEQALINILDGLENGSMSEGRAIEIMQNIGIRIDSFTESLLETTSSSSNP